MTGHALVAATERGDRAFADLVGGERGHDGEPAAALLGADARSSWGRVSGARRRRRAAELRGASSSSASSVGRGVRRGFAASRSRRRTASWRPRRPCAWSLRRACAVLLRRACALPPLHGPAFSSFLAALADARLLFGDLALFGLAQTRVGERVCARAALFVGERAQYDAGRLRRGGRRRSRCRRADGPPGRGNVALRRGRGTALDGRRRLRLGLARTDATLHLLDNDRLAATMAEALAHDALLDAAALERQRLGRSHAQLLAAFLFVSVIRVHFYTRSFPAGVTSAQPLRPSMLLIAGAKPL